MERRGLRSMSRVVCLSQVDSDAASGGRLFYWFFERDASAEQRPGPTRFDRAVSAFFEKGGKTRQTTRRARANGARVRERERERERPGSPLAVLC